MKPLSVLIADDDPILRRNLRRSLSTDPELSVVAEAADGDEAVRLIQDMAPELVFLDVQMPGRNGFEVIQEVGPDAMPATIFITSFDHAAAKAFEVAAVDFIVKPYEPERLQKSVERGKQAARTSDAGEWQRRYTDLLSSLHGSSRSRDASERQDGRFAIKVGNKVVVVRQSEIDWIEADRDYMVFHVGAQSHLMNETLTRLEARLDPAQFIRISRSVMVNIDRIARIDPVLTGDFSVILRDGTRFKIGSAFQDRVQRLIERLS